MTPQEQKFISDISLAACQSMLVTGIPASFVVAEGGLESTWGTSELCVKAMNIFGVKADSSWTGPVLLMRTREVVDGKWVMQEARWRKYSSWLDCIHDHAQFFLTNERYKAALQCHTGFMFAAAAAKAGYATDPDYAEKIDDIIASANLAHLDSFAAAKPVGTPVATPVVPVVAPDPLASGPGKVVFDPYGTGANPKPAPVFVHSPVAATPSPAPAASAPPVQVSTGLLSWLKHLF